MVPERLTSMKVKWRDEIVVDLYRKDKDMADEVLRGILYANAALDEHVCIRYKNKLYHPVLVMTELETRLVKTGPLHPSLHERMEAWLKDRFYVEKEERLLVSGYITSVFNASNWPEDWKLLLPDPLHPHINHINFYYCQNDYRTTLTPEQVQSFLTRHARYLTVLKSRLALNMLM